MRFKTIEISPAGKKQYLVALGRVDIELLLGEAINAERHLPRTDSLKPIRHRLKGIVAGLQEALEIAKADGDEGDRLPWVERKPATKTSKGDK